MITHDATVTEATMMRATMAYEALGYGNAVRVFLAHEPLLANYVLRETLRVLDSIIGDSPDRNVRAEELVRVAFITYEALRRGQNDLWNNQQDASL